MNKPTGTTTFNANFTAASGMTNEGLDRDRRRPHRHGQRHRPHQRRHDRPGWRHARGQLTFNFVNNELITGHGEISASSVNFANVGDIVVSGGDLAINSNFSPINIGIIFVPNNLKLQLPGTGNMQNTGLIVLNGGKITGPGGLTNHLGGEIRGGSSVETPLTNAGGLIRASRHRHAHDHHI